MTKQTYDYIALKPLANRFKEAAESITDDEIKEIIKDQLRCKIDEAIGDIDFYNVQGMLEEYLGEKSYEICDMAIKGIKRRLE